MTPSATAIDAPALRARHYNATVSSLRHSGDDLMIMRVVPDEPYSPYKPGQACQLGLGPWEPRSDGLPVEVPEPEKLERSPVIRRSYSICCPVLEDGVLRRVSDYDYLELYIVLVDEPTAALTPRLFRLKEGDRIYLSPKPFGRYTLEGVEPDDNVLFIGTGTGEAPHNAMLAELLAGGHRGRIASLVCVRLKRNLAYLELHRTVAGQYDRYAYVPLTTREPENVQHDHPAYIGKRYIQQYFLSDEIADEIGFRPDAEHTHVFLCGNPAMIGAPKTGRDGQVAFPETKGMVEILTEQGYAIHKRRDPGKIHFESYW